MISKNTILSKLGFSDFRPLQEEAIDALCRGQDVLLAAPTGGGKSLVYQSAGMIREGLGIIVSPLIALMSQQVDELRSKDIHAYFLNSNLTNEEQDNLVWAIRNNHIDLLFLSPEKVVQASVLQFLEGVDISLFAIDEAHCIAQWGDYFRPEYKLLGQLRELFPLVPIIALTGTVDQQTISTISDSLNLTNPLLLKGSFDRPNIEIHISQKRKAKLQILSFLHAEMAGESGIVYCRSRKKTEELSSWLSELGLPTLHYHAALPDSLKQEHHKRFSSQKGLIMVATTAYGMGIDIPHIRFVVHMDLPESTESYFQEIGRAGRDGRPAKALLLYGLQDMLKLGQFSSDNPALSSHQYQKAKPLFRALEARGCRRKNFLQHFGEESTECGNCDRCQHAASEQNATIASQKLLSLVYHTKGLQPFSVLIHILLGKRSKAVLSIQGEKLSLFGEGREFSEAQWKALIRHLIAFEYINIGIGQRFSVHLMEKSRDILKAKAQVLLSQERYYPVLDAPEEQEHAAKWHKLMVWKKSQEGVVLSESQLRKIYHNRPNSIASLSRLTGLPKESFSVCGESLISLLNEHEEKEYVRE